MGERNMKKILTSLIILGIATAGHAATGRAGMAGGEAPGGPPGEQRGPVMPIANMPGGGITSPINQNQANQPPAFTVENCMSAIRTCVENTFDRGITHMFFSPNRYSILTTAHICSAQVDRCVHEARRLDGQVAYRESSDVWADFNSRVVQPEYFNMVMNRTGLAPNLAERACLLMDRNRGGRPWDEVSRDNRAVLGPTLNAEVARGQWARWNPFEGQCEVRFAAYDGDSVMTDAMFRDIFGGVGGHNDAVIFVNAGDSVRCHHSTFDIGHLRRRTADFAIYGAVLGGGIGAIAGGMAGTTRTPGTPAGEPTVTTITRQEPGYTTCEGSPEDCENFVPQPTMVDVTLTETVPGTPGTSATRTQNTDRGFHQTWYGGAVIGAAGGAALAATIGAFIDQNRVNCRIGNSYETLSIGGRSQVPSLQDIVSRAAMRMPDLYLVNDGAIIATCAEWQDACESVSSANCEAAVVNFRPAGADRATLVHGACFLSNTCGRRNAVAVSHGACP